MSPMPSTAYVWKVLLMVVALVAWVHLLYCIAEMLHHQWRCARQAREDGREDDDHEERAADQGGPAPAPVAEEDVDLRQRQRQRRRESQRRMRRVMMALGALLLAMVVVWAASRYMQAPGRRCGGAAPPMLSIELDASALSGPGPAAASSDTMRLVNLMNSPPSMGAAYMVPVEVSTGSGVMNPTSLTNLSYILPSDAPSVIGSMSSIGSIPPPPGVPVNGGGPAGRYSPSPSPSPSGSSLTTSSSVLSSSSSPVSSSAPTSSSAAAGGVGPVARGSPSPVPPPVGSQPPLDFSAPYNRNSAGGSSGGSSTGSGGESSA